jgi:hypothetical protein
MLLVLLLLQLVLLQVLVEAAGSPCARGSLER